MQIYRTCVTRFGWSLREIDETDFETLMDFLFFENIPDCNTRVIDGVVYKRAAPGKPPNWL
jgi:hypothetical protein